MESRFPRSVALVGLKGAGKTTTGHALASRWKVPFHDSDAIIVNEFRTETRSHPALIENARDVFLRTGAETFRDFEFRALKAATDYPRHVLASGGGVAENEAAKTLLVDGWLVVFLDADPSLLFERVVSTGVPPFLNGPDPFAAWSDIAGRRRDLYRSFCHRRVEVTGKTVDEIVDEVDIVVMEEFNGGK